VGGVVDSFPDFEERYSKGYSFATLGDVLEGVGRAFRTAGAGKMTSPEN
jgi:hypothetical protein